MAITLTLYPVDIESGNYLNCFVGFKPIRLSFTANAGEVGVECVLIDATTSVDLLGFSLYADFDTNGLAVIDVSIVNDQGGQEPILESQQIVDSRIKYRVKYREAGTSGSYTIISAPEEPLIAVYNIADFNLDQWLNPITEPEIWLGYPVMTGFIHSDSNELGLDIVVYYDLLDIEKAVISADSVLKNFTSNAYGVLAVNLDIDAETVITVENAGATGTTDWINTGGAPNLAEYWTTTLGIAVFSKIVGGGFSGTAQRLQVVGPYANMYSTIVNTIDPTKQWYIRFKHRNSGTSKIQFAVGVTSNIPANTGDAELIEIALPFGGSTAFRVHFVVYTNANWLEVDEIELYTSDAVLPIETEYITYKIVSE